MITTEGLEQSQLLKYLSIRLPETTDNNQGPDFDDMSSYFPCIICGSFNYINPGYELLVTKM
jgi:hypothetical protein